MKVDVELRGWDEFQGKLRNAPNVIRDTKRQILRVGSIRVTKTAQLEAPNFDNNLRNSITPQIQTETARVGTNFIYARAQEKGFPAKYTFPNYKSGALRRWARIKLGDANKAFLVARKIYKKGMKGHHFMEKGLDDLRGNMGILQREFRRIVNSLRF